jgi:hypothetical protein
MIRILKYKLSFSEIFCSRIFHLFKRKRGRPPKTKSDGPTPVAPYTKHPHMNPIGLSLTPTINNQVILNEQHVKV